MRRTHWLSFALFVVCAVGALVGTTAALSFVDTEGVACACDCCTGTVETGCGMSGVLDDYGQCEAGSKPCKPVTDGYGHYWCECQCPKPPCQTCNGFPIQ